MKNYIVMDLEWNQSTRGKENSVENFPFEIIEIGAVKLNESLEQVGEFRRLIKPRVYKELHEKILEVTHMNEKLLMEEGMDFIKAMEEFKEWWGENPIFCTWGSMDLTELQRNLTYYGLSNPFKKPLFYYDIQKLYSLLYGTGKDRQSLDATVEALNIGEERPFHRALDDAYYTGRIMGVMEFEKVKEYLSIDYYRLPASLEEEIYHVFPQYSKYISRPFSTKTDAISDKIVTDLICCKCNRMLKKQVPWFSVNQKIYTSLGCCPVHGYIKGKIRMRRGEDGNSYVVKTMKLIKEEEAFKVYRKKAEVKKRRVER